MPRATSSWSLVSSRQTAASRSGASAARAASEAGSRRGDSNATTVSGELEHPLELARAPRQEALEAPAVDRQRPRRPARWSPPRARAAPRPRARARCRRGSGGSRGRRSPGCRRRRSAPPWPRARSAATSWRARSTSFCSWLETSRGRRDLEPLVQPPGAPGVLAGDQVGLLERPPRARAEVLEVADRGRADGQAAGHQRSVRAGSSLGRLALVLQRHRRGADHPGLGAELGGDAPASRSSAPAPARAARARRARAAARRRPRPRRRSRSRRARRCSRSWPGRRRGGGRSPATTSTAIPSPASAASVTVLPVISSPPASALPSAESGMRLGGDPPGPAERGARGERLDAAVIGAVALAAGAVLVDHHVAELGAGAGRAAVELAVEHQPAADPGADRQQDEVAASPCRRRSGARRAPPCWRRCR